LDVERLEQVVGDLGLGLVDLVDEDDRGPVPRRAVRDRSSAGCSAGLPGLAPRALAVWG